MEEPVQLTCECCGYTALITEQEAYESGWDTKERFSYTACPLCPGSWVFLKETYLHFPAHERWKVQGRPASIKDDGVTEIMAAQHGVTHEKYLEMMNSVEEHARFLKSRGLTTREFVQEMVDFMRARIDE